MSGFSPFRSAGTSPLSVSQRPSGESLLHVGEHNGQALAIVGERRGIRFGVEFKPHLACLSGPDRHDVIGFAGGSLAARSQPREPLAILREDQVGTGSAAPPTRDPQSQPLRLLERSYLRRRRFVPGGFIRVMRTGPSGRTCIVSSNPSSSRIPTSGVASLEST